MWTKQLSVVENISTVKEKPRVLHWDNKKDGMSAGFSLLTTLGNPAPSVTQGSVFCPSGTEAAVIIQEDHAVSQAGRTWYLLLVLVY